MIHQKQHSKKHVTNFIGFSCRPPQSLSMNAIKPRQNFFFLEIQCHESHKRNFILKDEQSNNQIIVIAS